MIGTFVLAVATSTVCATLLNQGILQWREYIGRRETARLSGLYAAIILENYCDLCSERLGANQRYVATSGQSGDEWLGLPDLPDYPGEIDWKRLGLKFAEKMACFRVDVTLAQRLITFRYDFDPPDGGDHDVLEQLSKKGLEAVQLARAIRKQHGLSNTAAAREHSSEEHLLASLKDTEEKLQRYREAQQASLAALREAAPS